MKRRKEKEVKKTEKKTRRRRNSISHQTFLQLAVKEIFSTMSKQNRRLCNFLFQKRKHSLL